MAAYASARIHGALPIRRLVGGVPASLLTLVLSVEGSLTAGSLALLPVVLAVHAVGRLGMSGRHLLGGHG